MIICEYIQDDFREYIHKRLDIQDCCLIQEHLSQCNDCREELRQLEEISTILKNLKQINLPKDYLEKLHKRIEAVENN